MTGDSVQLVEGVIATTGAAHFSLSDTGTLVYVRGDSREVNPNRVVWRDENGQEESRVGLGAPGNSGDGGARVSPDGRRIAVRGLSESGWDLYVCDAITGRRQRLTQGFVLESYVWTPDGRRIIVGSHHEAPSNIYSVLADGSGEPELLLPSDEWDFPTSVTPDGRKVVFSRGYGGQYSAHFEIWEVAISGNKPPVPLLQGEFRRRNGEYSPNHCCPK